MAHPCVGPASAGSVRPNSGVPGAAALKRPLSAILREETRQAHLSLECTPAMRVLMDPCVTRDAYVAWLRNWAACWPAVELALEKNAPASQARHLMPRMRHHLLADDLRALGVGSVTEQPAMLVPDMSGDRWLGAAYVVKGSQMGSTVIASHLRARLGLTGPGVSYFEAPGTDKTLGPAKDWQAWCGRLDALAVTPLAAQSAVDAARTLFGFLERRFSPLGAA